MDASNDSEPATERVTSYCGAAVLTRTLRSIGVAQSVGAPHSHQKRDRGYDEAMFVWRRGTPEIIFDGPKPGPQEYARGYPRRFAPLALPGLSQTPPLPNVARPSSSFSVIPNP
jgi:hypothetical protein